MADLSPAKSYTFLEEKAFIGLTTFEPDGTPITTSHWFAMGENCLYFEARSQDDAVRRIQFDAHVQVAACDHAGYPVGDGIQSVARIMTPLEMHRAKFALQEKYGIKKLATGMLQMFQPGDRLFIEVKPV